MDSELSEFLDETAESLTAIDAELLKFGQPAVSGEIFDTVFRLLHSIKGTSAFLNLREIETAAHAAEAELQDMRGAGSVHPHKLVAAFDVLRAVVARLHLERAVAKETELKIRTQRVGIENLRHFNALVSELAATRNSLMEILQRTENATFKEPLHRLSAIADELQKSVNALQQKSLGFALQILPRVVHDLAATLSKNIDFEIHGDELTVDAQIVDLIKDPLIQLIRNAADHGLETPQARGEVGKDGFGKIAIKALKKNGTLVIEITDDGRGLDLGKIRQAVISNGVATAGEFDAMSQHEIHKLVFAPGFTTVQTPTALSGRGFGLDIVRANIAALGGRIDMRSTEGKGTTVMITIPLKENEGAAATPSLPDINALYCDIDDTNVSFMVFRAGGVRLKAVPVQLITRLEEIDMRQIKTAGGNKWVYSGEDVVPLVYVNASLAASGKAPQPMLVFSDPTRAMGLVVDEIIGVAQAPLNIAFSGSSDDTIGSIVLNGAPADIIDIGYYLPLAFGGEAQISQEMSPVAAKSAGRKLILVEDSAFFRDMLLPVLKNAGFDVQVFGSANDALEAMKTDTLPAAVVSDIDMPGMSGFDFARTLKADARMADVPLIALSSFLSRTAAERGREAGFKTYIAKFDRSGLLKALKRNAPVQAA